jgi:hypothetical protein
MGKPLRDLTGQVFSRLTVIERGLKPSDSKKTGAWWICSCECGNVRTIYGSLLTTGHTKSCGCYKSDVNRNAMSTMQFKKYGETIDRFFKRFKVNEQNGCWEWLSSSDKDGYGLLWGKGKRILAHRYSYKHHYGIDPGELNVCHKCDNPRCVNPDHLFLGTTKDNVQDCMDKGRDAMIGSRNNKAKLTEDDIPTIREDKRKSSDIAKTYNVSKSTIKKIKNKSSWSHVL